MPVLRDIPLERAEDFAMAEPEILKAAIAAWEKEAEKNATKPKKTNCRASLKNTEVKGVRGLV